MLSLMTLVQSSDLTRRKERTSSIKSSSDLNTCVLSRMCTHKYKHMQIQKDNSFNISHCMFLTLLCILFCRVSSFFFPPPSSLLHVKRIPSKNHPKYHIMERAWNDSWERYLDYQSQCMKVNLMMFWDVSVGNFFMLFKNFY